LRLKIHEIWIPAEDPTDEEHQNEQTNLFSRHFSSLGVIIWGVTDYFTPTRPAKEAILGFSRQMIFRGSPLRDKYRSGAFPTKPLVSFPTATGHATDDVLNCAVRVPVNDLGWI
jgi:hypothetical protein